MRIGNLAGRLTVFTEHGAIDVEQTSAGEFSADPQAIYSRWEEFRRWWAGHEPRTDAAVPFTQEDLGAPAPHPAQVLAIGLNYRDHVAEAGFAIPDSPTVFTKFVSSLTGPIGDIVL